MVKKLFCESRFFSLGTLASTTNVAETELLPYKELFTTVVPEQGLAAAATSCFHVANLVAEFKFCQRNGLLPKKAFRNLILQLCVCLWPVL